MKQVAHFLGDVIGVSCILLFCAAFFYHTTNDYFFVAGKFRDFSLIGWGAMLLLLSVAFYFWHKGKNGWLYFSSWLVLICIVLEFYRFLLFAGNENCRLYLKIVMGLEIATLVLALYRRYYEMVIFSIAAFIITFFGSFVVYSSSLCVSGYVLFATIGIGAFFSIIKQICLRHNYLVCWHWCKICLGVILVGMLAAIGVMWYQHMVFGIRFYEKPVTEAVKNPKVSIIVPVYNAEDTIEHAMDSLRKQTLKHIEIIAVDDGSTDKTAKILDEYAAFDKRIKVIHQKNAYVGAARNRGIAQAKGEYIGFVDADDWVSPNYYEELYKKAKAQRADIAYISVIWVVFKKFPEIKERLLKNYSSDVAHLETIGTGYVWDKIYKRSFLQENHILFTTRRSVYEDGYFAIQLLAYAPKIVPVTNVAYYYSRHRLSASVKKHYAINQELFNMFSDLDKLIFDADLDEEKKQWVLEKNKLQRHWFFRDFYTVLDDEDKPKFKQLVAEKFPDDVIDYDKVTE